MREEARWTPCVCVCVCVLGCLGKGTHVLIFKGGIVSKKAVIDNLVKCLPQD